MILLAMLMAVKGYSGNKIKYYFTQPVNNSVSRGENAIYLNDKMGDTIVAYINRAKYTLDIAVYNYTSSFPAIAVAVNNAYTRGVQVRWIYDSSSSNTGIPLLNGNIKRMASPPDAGDHSIMHNKFMIIDANSSDPNDAILWTGSTNWNTQQFNTDHNNAVAIQDKPLALAYKAHFEMMWGSTGATPNRSAAKFGQYKTDLGAHHFTVEGKHIEVYFSPADNTNDHILSAMGSAHTDMYFGMSTFTYSTDANMLATSSSSDVYVAGISDAGNVSYAPHSILSSALGSGKYKVYSGSGLFHHKYLIVDPSNTCSDPLVLTGSHNWTVSADTRNDENTIIIHDATAANVFYQSFHASFTALGGSLPVIPDCGVGIDDISGNEGDVLIYPTPSDGDITIKVTNIAGMQIQVFDMNGMLVQSTAAVVPGTDLHIGTPGIYTIRCISKDRVVVKQAVIR
ncbi:hypothetical protein GCM10023093_01980 [Nemorincola caseinilytica]|uniref:phospholipase D n=1 Tax=Nemorincola caseinilytica TaxID=2054315 RepID=A0ABP8N5M9_9BACT